jgi:hypothetical protein
MRFASKSCYLVTILAILLVSLPAQASEIAYEGFGRSFPIYANDGTGFGGPWTQGGFNAFASGYVPRDRTLCYPRLQTSAGSVSGGAFSAINGAIRDLASPIGANGTTVYLSFLVQPQGTLNDGVFDGFFGVTLNGSLGNDFFVGKPGAGSELQYVLETRGGSGQVPSGASVVVGRTTLLVVKVQFLAGNDTYTLFVNPTPGHPEPASSIIKSDLDLGNVSKIGIYSTGAFIVDEIRLGTTFEDVTPTSGGGHSDSHEGCGEDQD